MNTEGKKRLKEVSLLRETHLNFKVVVEGSAEKPQGRLSLDLPDFTLSFPVEFKENGEITATIPALGKGLVQLQEVDKVTASLEMVVENQYFVPWEDTLSIKKEVQVGEASAFLTQAEPTLQVRPVSFSVKEYTSEKDGSSALNNNSGNKQKTSERLAQLRRAGLRG